MPAPILSDFFGTNATVLTADATITATTAAPALVIYFADLSDVGLDDTASATAAQAWFGAFLKKAEAFTTANTDEVPNITVSGPDEFTSFTVLQRNSASKIERPYTVNTYEPYGGADDFDPDNLA